MCCGWSFILQYLAGSGLIVCYAYELRITEKFPGVFREQLISRSEYSLREIETAEIQMVASLFYKEPQNGSFIDRTVNRKIHQTGLQQEKQ